MIRMTEQFSAAHQWSIDVVFVGRVCRRRTRHVLWPAEDSMHARIIHVSASAISECVVHKVCRMQVLVVSVVRVLTFENKHHHVCVRVRFAHESANDAVKWASNTTYSCSIDDTDRAML